MKAFKMLIPRILLCVVSVFCLSDDIYHDITVGEGSACYRLFNGTHQFGCMVDKADSSGVVVVLKSDDDVKAIESCWRDRFLDYTGNYYVVIDLALMNGRTVELIRNSSCITGVILIDEKAYSVDYMVPLSHDGQCPEARSGYYKDGCEANAWNKNGAITREGLRDVDWNKQVVYLTNKTEIQLIEKCHDLFNVPREGSTLVSFPFCSASFGVFSAAAGSSKICYRRSQSDSRLLSLDLEGTAPLCHPLTEKNVYSFFPPRVYDKDRKKPYETKYLILTSRLDSFGLIPEVSPGEQSVITSVITLMAAAHAMGSNSLAFEKAANKSNKHVIFAFFNGEAFDYIGSSTMVFNMQNKNFPLSVDERYTSQLEPILIDQIAGVVEAQQIDGNGELQALVDGEQLRKDTPELSALLASLIAGAQAVGGSISSPSKDSRVPPASWHTFAKHASTSVPGVILAPFADSYTYRRVNSMLDKNVYNSEQRAAAINSLTVAASAMLQAGADFVGLTEEEKRKLEIDERFMNSLFDCLVVADNWYECEFIKKFGHKGRVYAGMYEGKSTYVSSNSRNPLRLIVEWLLIYATGSYQQTSNVSDEKSCNSIRGKQKIYNFNWQSDPYSGEFHCYRSSVFWEHAISPAFLINDYDLSNSTYSTWTESMYTISDLRLFLVERRSFEWILLAAGFVVVFFSFLIAARCTEDSLIVDEGERRAELGEPL